VPIDRAATLRNAETLLRQGELEPAIEEFVRIADGFHGEGFLQKAAALYKKILKLAPDHDHAMFRVAEIAAEQGLVTDARAGFAALEEKRRARGDARGAAEVRVQLGTLSPTDFAARRSAAAARVEIGDAEGAARDLKGIAADLEAIGRTDQAFEILCDAAQLDPDDHPLRARIAREFLGRGNVDDAARYLTAQVAGSDPELLKIVFDMNMRRGHLDDAVSIAERLLADDDTSPVESDAVEDTVVTLEGLTSAEIDQVLDELEPRVPEPAMPPAASTPGALTGSDLEDVFGQLRAEATQKTLRDAADKAYHRAAELQASGDVDGYIEALKAASVSPAFRFETASRLGRIYRDGGSIPESIEWMERAAQAPAPSPAEYHALLFDLAQALEASGDVTRALAVCLELKADAGSYRDVDARVDRLAKVQARE
jgi:tetratricopeptide (TPR) repeat protein